MNLVRKLSQKEIVQKRVWDEIEKRQKKRKKDLKEVYIIPESWFSVVLKKNFLPMCNKNAELNHEFVASLHFLIRKRSSKTSAFREEGGGSGFQTLADIGGRGFQPNRRLFIFYMRVTLVCIGVKKTKNSKQS